jgi:hypothetical protein
VKATLPWRDPARAIVYHRSPVPDPCGMLHDESGCGAGHGGRA